MARVALCNGYSARNIGDGLLVENAVELISRERPGASLVIVAMDPDSFAGRFEGAEVVAAPVRSARELVRLPGVLLALASGGRVGSRELRALRGVEEAFSVGGGFLQIRSPRELVSVALVHLSQLMMCRRLGARLVMLPQSVGPFRGRLPRRLARRVLSWFDVLFVREEASRAHVLELDARLAGRLHRAPDLCVLSTARRPPPPDCPSPRRVGLVVRQWWFPGHSDPRGAYEAYLDQMAAVAAQLRDRGDRVDLLVQSSGPTTRGDDRLAAAAVSRRLAGALQVVEPPAAAPANALIRRYGDYDLLIATRLHAALMGLLAGVPCIAIAYEWKTRGILSSLELEHWVLDIEHVRACDVLALRDDASSFPLEAVVKRLDGQRDTLLALVGHRSGVTACAG